MYIFQLWYKNVLKLYKKIKKIFYKVALFFFLVHIVDTFTIIVFYFLIEQKLIYFSLIVLHTSLDLVLISLERLKTFEV